MNDNIIYTLTRHRAGFSSTSFQRSCA